MNLIHRANQSCFELERTFLRSSFQLGEKIDQNEVGRIGALAIPVICLLSEAAKVFANAAQVAEGICTLKPGNVQTIAMHLFEHARNLLGCSFGFFVGLYDIRLARRAFLIGEAKELTRKLSEVDAARLLGTAAAVGQFFEKHGIDYRISAGTALGAFRHQGMIPHDDDIDLVLHPRTQEKLDALITDGTFERETKMQIRWQPFTGGWQCFHPDAPKGKGKLEEIGLPFIDIFKMRLHEGKIIYDAFEMRALCAEDYFTEEEWGEPKEYAFGPIKLRGIADLRLYIERVYGLDSLEYAYMTIPHEELASAFENLSNIPSHIAKLKKYGFPRRAYIADRSAITYDRELFERIERCALAAIRMPAKL